MMCKRKPRSTYPIGHTGVDVFEWSLTSASISQCQQHMLWIRECHLHQLFGSSWECLRLWKNYESLRRPWNISRFDSLRQGGTVISQYFIFAIICCNSIERKDIVILCRRDDAWKQSLAKLSLRDMLKLRNIGATNRTAYGHKGSFATVLHGKKAKSMAEKVRSRWPFEATGLAPSVNLTKTTPCIRCWAVHRKLLGWRRELPDILINVKWCRLIEQILRTTSSCLSFRVRFQYVSTTAKRSR